MSSRGESEPLAPRSVPSCASCGRPRSRSLRREAIAWLTIRTHDGRDPLTSDEILNDFLFDGERFPLMDRQRGIRKPAVLDSALSFRTTWRPDGAERPYDDAVGADGLIRYKWRGDDPNHAENRALRTAMEGKKPLIWFWGVGQGLYQAIFPVFLVDEEKALQQFVVATDGLQQFAGPSSPVEGVMREWVTAETKRRVHQRVFRSMVMRAYDNQCAICSLRHSELLDAAHIVDDKHELGIAAVRNGLALCKIHHAAMDHRILGVRPDLVLEVRADILGEIDGPMLRHGIQELHRQPLRVVPTARSEKPAAELLAIQYEAFKAARAG